MEEWDSHLMPLAGKKCYEAYHERDKPCKFCLVHKTLATSQAIANQMMIALFTASSVLDYTRKLHVLTFVFLMLVPRNI